MMVHVKFSPFHMALLARILFGLLGVAVCALLSLESWSIANAACEQPHEAISLSVAAFVIQCHRASTQRLLSCAH